MVVGVGGGVGGAAVAAEQSQLGVEGGVRARQENWKCE